jgi:membrane-bound ClpP family serine protease
VDWIAVDLDHQIRYAQAFPQEQKALKKTMRLLSSLSQSNYRVQQVSDGVVLLQRDGAINPQAQLQLDQLLQNAKER